MTGQASRGPGAPRRRQAPRARTGRRAGDSGTREAILQAARHQFADRGYDGATIRAIAAAAAVDPALVHHFYGTKERLFAAAMRLPFVPSEVITAALTEGGRGDGESVGEHMVKTALTLWDNASVRAAFVGILRSALTSEQAATMLREFITEAILRPVAAVASDTDPERTPFRSSLVGSQMLGLALTRYIVQLGPLAVAGPDELAAAIGPTIDRYLTGDLGQAAGR
ncbi:MAG TPA: TetR family transcriptional regulator [Streptosporangiaceae bacterium]|nr:TetR family transcriptional regulator [Streptosporangiaceae bacterium]